jgi:SAM-dependent methyltransferase
MFETCDVVCDLCKISDADFLFDGKDRLYGCDGVFTYVRCKNCGLVYMNPQIHPEEIGKLYPENYAPHRPKKAGGDECEKSFGARIKKIPALAALLNAKRKFLGRAQIASGVLKKLNRHSRVLDVGCGYGQFLNRIRSETSCEVYGVDIAPEAAAAAKEYYGIDIFTGTIAEAPFSKGLFDMITSWWCLEHVPNPSEVLQKMCSLLKCGGLCVIGVPNIDSFNGRIFKDKWYHLDCPRHLHLYSPNTITKLLDKAGFVVTKMVFDKSSWGLFRSLQYYLGDDNIPLKQRKRPRHASSLKRLLLPWTILLGLLKQSDIMVIYARKKDVPASTNTKDCIHEATYYYK